MKPEGQRMRSPFRRLLDRVAGIAVVLGLVTTGLTGIGLAGRSSSPAPDRTPPALLDLAQLGEALGRGELPVELLVAGALAALAIGLGLSLLVATLRQRRRRSVAAPDPAPAEPFEAVVASRTTLPWPMQDADVFRPPSPAGPVEDDPHPLGSPSPGAVLDAAQAEAWAAREATAEAAREATAWAPGPPPDAGRAPAQEVGGASEAADAAPTWARTDLPLPYAAIGSIVSPQASRADIPPARSTLGTPAAPLVVELHDEREGARRRGGPNLPLVAAIGTVAAGVAFSTGAAVGAMLGAGTGAAIGLAFAGGAGVAVGAMVALLGGRRR